MPTLSVTGAVLDYVTLGQGPHLLLIPGAPGNRSIFNNVLEPLSKHFTVTAYSRRGFSFSHLNAAQDYSRRQEQDAADAAALITHLSPHQPIYIFGTSSGAIIAQTLLVNHPEVVCKVIAHEPPSISLLPPPYRDGAAAGFQALYDVYRAQGPHAALPGFFAAALASPAEIDTMTQAMDPNASADMRADIMYFFERELLVYPPAVVNIEGLKASKDKLIPCLSEAAVGKPAGAPIEMIAYQLGRELLKIKGGHIGYVTDPEDFVLSLREVLS